MEGRCCPIDKKGISSSSKMRMWCVLLKIRKEGEWKRETGDRRQETKGTGNKGNGRRAGF
jgi:hypothetical protein